MTKSLEATRPFQTYKQRLGHDINGIRPVMIPDDSGEWVNRHAAEHLAEQMERTKQEKSHLEFRLKNVQDAFLAGDERALRAERRIAYLEKTLRGTEETLIAATDNIAELEARQLCVKPRLAPHKYRECVNELLEQAIAYAGTQQLRERLAYSLENYIEPDHPHTRRIMEGSD